MWQLNPYLLFHSCCMFLTVCASPQTTIATAKFSNLASACQSMAELSQARIHS